MRPRQTYHHPENMRLSHLLGSSPAFSFSLVVSLCGFVLFMALFKLPPSPSKEEHRVDDLVERNIFSRRRTELYESMATDLEKQGAKFLAGGTTSQSLNLSDIFTFKDGKVYPILKPADPAVRAAVLYLGPQYAKNISDTVKKILAPHFPGEIWFQDPNLYHFSMFHASHHLEPVVATPPEVDAEARMVESVARRCCPLSIILERVVLTSTGVLLGCWQVTSGTDPAVIRRELRGALPRSPAKQLYDQVMLHTSFARLLGPPEPAGKALVDSANNLMPVLDELVSQLNRKLQHFKAIVEELWFVEELDVLALALRGRIKPHRFSLQCLSN